MHSDDGEGGALESGTSCDHLEFACASYFLWCFVDLFCIYLPLKLAFFFELISSFSRVSRK